MRVKALQLGAFQAQRGNPKEPVKLDPVDPALSDRRSADASPTGGGTSLLKGALDVYVHVEGTPTKVSVVERPAAICPSIRSWAGTMPICIVSERGRTEIRVKPVFPRSTALYAE